MEQCEACAIKAQTKRRGILSGSTAFVIPLFKLQQYHFLNSEQMQLHHRSLVWGHLMQ